MKTTKLLFAMLLWSQFVIGQSAPNYTDDWTVTDYNGNTWNLYEILENGYTVFLDFSSSTCSPCWNYHQAGHFSQVWYNHGPIGEPGVSPNSTNDVFVFLLMSDDPTGPYPSSYGNFVTGTNYPIIPLAGDYTYQNMYNVSGIPAFRQICPDGEWTSIPSSSASQLYALRGQCNSLSTGNNAALSSYLGEESGCLEIPISVRLQNMGTGTLTSCSFEVSDGTTTFLTQTWNGNLEPYQFVNVDLGAFNPPVAGNYTIEITSPDANLSDNSWVQYLRPSIQVENQIGLDIKLDHQAYQTSWDIQNEQGIVIDSGSDWWSLLPAGNSIYGAFYDLPVTTLATEGCYKFNLYDTNNNGLAGDPGIVAIDSALYYEEYGPGNWSLTDQNGTIITQGQGDFGSVHSAWFYFGEGLGLEEHIQETLIYPNPTQNSIYINWNSGEYGSLTVRDLSGKILIANFPLQEGNQNKLDLDAFSEGIYLVDILKNNEVIATQRIVRW